jgi:hypothetical protein
MTSYDSIVKKHLVKRERKTNSDANKFFGNSSRFTTDVKQPFIISKAQHTTMLSKTIRQKPEDI